MAKVRGQDSQQVFIPAEDGCGLHGTEPGSCGNVAMGDEKRVRSHVFEAHSFCRSHRTTAGRSVLHVHRLEVVQKIQSESPLRNDMQDPFLRIEQLNIPQVSAECLVCSVEL